MAAWSYTSREMLKLQSYTTCELFALAWSYTSCEMLVLHGHTQAVSCSQLHGHIQAANSWLNTEKFNTFLAHEQHEHSFRQYIDLQFFAHIIYHDGRGGAISGTQNRCLIGPG